MPHIEIDHPHALGPEGARKALSTVAEELERDLGVRAAWHGDVLHVTGMGVDGRLHAGPDAFHVTVKLGLRTRALRPVIQREITQQLDRLANPTPTP